ncbi:MAG: Eco57I restriction-modification methylase domain-containing protein, partial [Saprospiraceae bacterium]
VFSNDILEICHNFSRTTMEKNILKLNRELAVLQAELDKLNEIIGHLHELQTRTDKPYFLWHLWFKDVFDKGGFDIVIGNPPYIQLQKYGGELAKALQQQNYETFERTGDVYAIFYELGFNLLTKKGIHTFITSSQWLRANYGKSLRKYFLKKNPLTLLELGPGLFESATVDTNILIAKNEEYKKQLHGEVITNLKEISHVNKNSLQEMPYVNEENWAILNPVKQSIKEKFKTKGKALSEWKIEIYRGVLTGFNEAFIINEEKKKELIKADAKNAEIVKPILRGREIDKYLTEWDGGFIISTFPALHIDISKYKAIKKYLETFLPKINQTGETFINDEGVEEKTRKKTGNKWFETQDQIGYYKELSKEKIIWKRIGSQLRFSYSDKEIYCLDSTCIATGEKIKYLTALLNSKLCQYQLFESSPKTGMGDLIISVQALEPLLVYYPNDEEQKQIETLVNKILELKKEKLPTINFENKIDALVFHLYKLTESEMLQVLDTFKDLSIKDRNQIQNEYWNIANNKFSLEL